MKRRAFSSSDVLTIDTALGKSRREERADYLLEAAEEKAEVKHGNYAGCAIWERDLKAIARGEQVRTIDRGARTTLLKKNIYFLAFQILCITFAIQTNTNRRHEYNNN